MTPQARTTEQLRTWLARSTLIATLLMVVWQLAPSLPREQELLFELPGPAGVKLIVSWQASSQEGLAGGFEVNLQGARRVRHVASMPNGTYAFTVQLLERFGHEAKALESRSFIQHVRLEGGPTTIYLTKGPSW